MIDVPVILAGIALVMMLVGVAVFRRQARASSCPRHSHLAGRVAVVAGWISLIGGVGLMVYAFHSWKNPG